MKILVLGSEGYIGTALCTNLINNGHEVQGVDCFMRESNVNQMGSESLTERKSSLKEKVDLHILNIAKDYERLCNIIKNFNPNTIVHLAEQPSAAFSMCSPETASETQQNNVIGTLNVLWAMREHAPNSHLIKLGTEGEYPDWLWDGKHIPEGNRMTVKYNNEDWVIPTPRYAGSWYHFSKLHDSMNIDYACRIWGLKATDVNQGIVYGHLNNTRLDYDEAFGTVVNRFAVQAVLGHPLSIYGQGGQTRGFIALQNSIEAIELLAKNEPDPGQFRVIHQTTEEYSVNDIAGMIQGLTMCDIKHIKNPRAENDHNDFTFDNSTLMDLGLQPVKMEDVLPDLIQTVRANQDNIREEVILPKIKWN